jgi:hypothetical protein
MVYREHNHAGLSCIQIIRTEKKKELEAKHNYLRDEFWDLEKTERRT